MLRWDDLSSAELDRSGDRFWSSGGSRSELAQSCGFSRSKANTAVAALIERGMIDETGAQASSGGRRPESSACRPAWERWRPSIWGRRVSMSRCFPPTCAGFAYHAEAIEVRDGPGVVLPRVRAILRDLRRRCGLRGDQIIAIGMGVPGPVEFGSGLLVAPPIIPAGRVSRSARRCARTTPRRCSSTTTSTPWPWASCGGCTGLYAASSSRSARESVAESSATA